ncbi:MAG: hypothetical protein ACRDQ6_20845 [Pseudonocardiaceae bacterium]
MRAAVVVLDWLATEHLTLASCRQADLERWLSSGEVSYRYPATTVTLRRGSTPITLPDPVAELTQQLLDGKRGHATTGAGHPSPWLFPGGQPGRPISASHLGQRLKTSVSNPVKHVPPRYSSSPPNSPPPCSPACSASTSTSPPPGNAPQPETGRPTPQTSAAEANPHNDPRNEGWPARVPAFREFQYPTVPLRRTDDHDRILRALDDDNDVC